MLNKTSHPTGAGEVSRGSTQIYTGADSVFLLSLLPVHLLGPVTGSSVRPTGRAGLKPAPSKPFGVTLTGGIRWILSGGDSQSVVSTPWRLFTSYSSRSTRYEDWRNYTTLSAPGKGSRQAYRWGEVVMQMNGEIFGWSPFSNLDSHVKLFAQ